jgi:colicin import membrane protein
MEDRLAFAPPPPPGLLRAIVLAVLAHLLLVLALTLGLRWQRDAQPVAAEAELWARVPQEAAPKPVPVPPPAPPAPVVKPPPLPTPPQKSDADIALERAKLKRELEREKQQALQRAAEKREAAERKQAQLEKEKEQRRKLEAERKHEEELERKHEEELERKKEQARQAAVAKRKEEEKQRKLEQEEKRLAKLREDNIRRSLNMATGSGSADARGSAAQSSGPSASWGAKVQARVRPKIVFTETISGNPKAEVEVRTAPDGTIVGKKLVRSSGSQAWDDAVLRALDKTEALPRDTDGRVPSPVVIEFRPHG